MTNTYTTPTTGDQFAAVAKAPSGGRHCWFLIDPGVPTQTQGAPYVGLDIRPATQKTQKGK